MQQRLTLEMVLAFAVLAICIFAYGESSAPTWWWMVMIGSALAAIVFANGWSERGTKLTRPPSAKVVSFVASELVLPVLVLASALTAWVTGGETWLDAAIVLAVALAALSLV